MSAREVGRQTYAEQPFLGHLADAVLLCELAEQLPQLSFGRHGTLARASMMTAAFCVEAAANALLSPLDAPKFLLDVVDRLPVLDKFHFILFAVQPTRQFERGNRHAQEIHELFDLRSRFVHPRPQDREVTHRHLGDHTYHVRKQAPPTNHLKVPQSPEDWSTRDVIRVLRAISDFLDYFVLDLCEFPGEEARSILLARIDVDGKRGLLLPRRLRHVFARACTRWPIDFRLVRLLTATDSDSEDGPSLQLDIRYSWSKGGMQVHDIPLSVSVPAPQVSNAALADGIMRFLLWFDEAQAVPFGRSVTQFDIHSEHGKLAEYRAFVPSGRGDPDPVSDPQAIGVVMGVDQHFFANGLVNVRLDGALVFITLLVEGGTGRVLTVPVEEAVMLARWIAINRRNEWVADADPVAMPEVVDEKGSDYRVTRVEVFAYDPTSRTTFVTYDAEHGRKVQFNMSGGTAMLLLTELAARLSTGIP